MLMYPSLFVAYPNLSTRIKSSPSFAPYPPRSPPPSLNHNISCQQPAYIKYTPMPPSATTSSRTAPPPRKSTAVRSPAKSQTTAGGSSGRQPAAAPTAPHPILGNAKASVPPNTPRGRWETLYVYAFTIKFLPPPIEDMYDAMQ